MPVADGVCCCLKEPCVPPKLFVPERPPIISSMAAPVALMGPPALKL